jgi:hypothetical protein
VLDTYNPTLQDDEKKNMNYGAKLTVENTPQDEIGATFGSQN